jgi:hypothetical protein
MLQAYSSSWLTPADPSSILSPMTAGIYARIPGLQPGLGPVETDSRPTQCQAMLCGPRLASTAPVFSQHPETQSQVGQVGTLMSQVPGNYQPGNLFPVIPCSKRPKVQTLAPNLSSIELLTHTGSRFCHVEPGSMFAPRTPEPRPNPHGLRF